MSKLIIAGAVILAFGAMSITAFAASTNTIPSEVAAVTSEVNSVCTECGNENGFCNGNECGAEDCVGTNGTCDGTCDGTATGEGYQNKGQENRENRAGTGYGNRNGICVNQ